MAMTTEERLLRLENAFTTLVELARNFDERLDDHDSLINTLGANISALSDIVAEVAKNQRRTDEQLNNLAALVERYIREGGKGQP
jgi:ABC-type transporter Mla subunit MlaD